MKRIWDKEKLIGSKDFNKRDNPNDIVAFFKNVARRCSTITIWQDTLSKGQISSEVKLYVSNQEKGEVAIFPCNEEEKVVDFNENIPLGLFSRHDQTVAEVKISYIGQRYMVVFFAKEIFVKDCREALRVIPSTPGKMVSIVNKQQTEQFPLIDISARGVAILIPPDSSKFFKDAQEEVIIAKIPTDNGEEEVKARVIYIKKMDSSGHYRVGIKFQTKLNIISV